MSHSLIRLFAALIVVAVGFATGRSQQAAGPVQVVIKDARVVANEPSIPLDPTPRIAIGHANGQYFGLTVEGKLISCTANASIWSSARIDNQEINSGFDGFVLAQGKQPPQMNLPPGPYGKKRLGTLFAYKMGPIDVTQTIEIVPSKPQAQSLVGKAFGGQKRKLDTARISYVLENKDTKPHTVEWKVGMDTLIGNNDGCLFASPTTHPGKVLDGVMLKDKDFPEYVQVLENPNLMNPGFVATMTFKNGGRVDNPNRVALTGLGGLGNGFEAQLQQANGDSGAAIYWEKKTLKPGEKRTLVWAYGGGIASDIENEGRVSLALGGSFEPGKTFTVTATVDDPAPGQALTLELPAGMTRVEGKEIQPVPAPDESTGASVVLWKARVLQTGDHEVRVRSSTGVTQIKHVSIKATK